MPGMSMKDCAASVAQPVMLLCVVAFANDIFRFKADHFHFQSFILFHDCVLLSALVCTFSLPFTIIDTYCKDVNTNTVLYVYTGYIQKTVRTPCNPTAFPTKNYKNFKKIGKTQKMG